MSLKILVVPFSILLSLIIMIGFIKPDIEVVQEKKNLLTAKTTQSKDMGVLLDNISKLTTSLDEQSESVDLLDIYIPQAMDQERAIDMLNYLASQSGVSVSTVEMRDVKIELPEEVITDQTGEEVMPAGPSKSQAKAFSASVKVTGEYASMKDFFHRLAHMNRFHKIQRFSLGVMPDNEKEGVDIDALVGTFDAQFDYFPAYHLETAVNVPVFLRGAFDTTELTSLHEWISYPVSPLREPATGRPNPFQ